METVEQVEEAATVLRGRQTGEGGRGCPLARPAVNHHFKVLVCDVAEGGADVAAAEPLTRPAPPLLPGRQAAQSLRQADLQLVVCRASGVRSTAGSWLDTPQQQNPPPTVRRPAAI